VVTTRTAPEAGNVPVGRSWLAVRLPVGSFWSAFLAERIPGGARWAYVFGSLCLALLAVQFVTGVTIALFYVPEPDAALASISYVSSRVACGRIVLGIHHWSANIFVGAVLLHMAQTFVYGAYKKPRELVWLSGVVLLLLVQGFHFTGFVLPWDQRGYWATEVGTAIISTTPLVGDLLMRVIRGGEELGALTLSHFYAVHVLILTAAVALFAVLHLACLRWVGPAGAWRPALPAAERKQFFPHQVLKDAIVIALVLTLIVGLAAFAYTPPASVADPTEASFLPRPEWNFLFLYQLQRYFPGSLEWLGTMVVPGVLVLFLVAVPFLDRQSERSPARRFAMVFGGVTVASFVVLLTVLAVASDPATWAYVTRPTERTGARLYAENDCATCHRVRGEGASSAPDLSFIGQMREIDWLRTYVRDPDSLNPATTMPPYKSLSEKEIDAIAAYLKSLR
jgi:ubiquinol-cytochrome c reductase cytochrome b subunit